MTTLTIIRRLVTPSDKTKPTFFAYEYIAANGRKVDLRFRKDVDIRVFDGLVKFKASFEEFQVSTRYEYPRAYAGGFVVGSIIDLTKKESDTTPAALLPF